MENLINNGKWIFGLLVLLVSSGSLYGGGGWPQPKGEIYLKFGHYFIIADNYYTPAGHIIDIRTTGYYATSAYLEWGITDKLTAIAYVPFFVRSTLNKLENINGNLIEEGDQLNSFGDSDIAFKYGIFNKAGVVAALSATFGLPLGNNAGGRTRLLQSGDGEFNQQLTLEVSSSLPSGKAYGTILVAFNNRTRNFSDEFKYGLEIGAKIKKIWLITRFLGRESLNNGDDRIIPTNGIFNNNIEYLSFSPEIAYEVKNNFGFSIGGGFAFWGKQILADPAYTAGVYFKL